jgi:hypothetical protein
MIGCMDAFQVFVLFVCVARLVQIVVYFVCLVKFRVRAFATDIPSLSPLDPLWVGFSVEETNIFKGKRGTMQRLLPVLFLMVLLSC